MIEKTGNLVEDLVQVVTSLVNDRDGVDQRTIRGDIRHLLQQYPDWSQVPPPEQPRDHLVSREQHQLDLNEERVKTGVQIDQALSATWHKLAKEVIDITSRQMEAHELKLHKSTGPSPYLEQFKAEVLKSLEIHKSSTRAHVDVMKAQITRVNNRIDKKFERHNRRFHQRSPYGEDMLAVQDPDRPSQFWIVKMIDGVGKVVGVAEAEASEVVTQPEPKG